MTKYYGIIDKQRGTRLPNLQKEGYHHFHYGDFSLFTSQHETLVTHENEEVVFFTDGLACIKGNEGFLDLYKKYKSSFIRFVSGEFNIILWEKKKGALRVYRDHVGTRPIYYHENVQFMLFSNDIRIVKSFTGSQKLDEEWLADLLSGTISEKHVTPFSDIMRLPPAHILQATSTQKSSLKKYWDVNLQAEPSVISEKEAIDQFRMLLEEAVKKRISGSKIIGAELSGGLDSTVVASLANRISTSSNKGFFAFSHIMEDSDVNNLFPFKDEREYISEVTKFAELQHHDFIRPGNAAIMDMLENSLRVQGGPTQQRFYEFSDLLYARAQQRSVNLLFSGFGGDEGVSSHGGGYLHEFMYHHEWRRLHRELIAKEKNLANAAKKWLLVALQVYFRDAYHLYAHHFGSEYLRIRKKIRQLPLKKEILKKYNIHERAQQKSRFPNDVLLKNRQYKRLMHAHVSQRMEYSAVAAREYSIEYRYPLWDKDLLQFYLQLPTHMKRNGNVGRYIYRKSVEGIIPESIRWRNDKTGATIPSVYRRLLNDVENIRIFLDKCVQKGIGTDFLDVTKMKIWLDDMLHRNQDKNVYQGMFFNYLMFLKYLEWQYEGKN